MAKQYDLPWNARKVHIRIEHWRAHGRVWVAYALNWDGVQRVVAYHRTMYGLQGRLQFLSHDRNWAAPAVEGPHGQYIPPVEHYSRPRDTWIRTSKWWKRLTGKDLL